MIQSAGLILNPASGTGDFGDQLARIKEMFADRGVKLDVFETAADKPPPVQAKAALERAPDALVACGGDGTVSAVAGVAADHGLPLGILPSGTANAFAAALGTPRSLAAACEVILEGHVREVDIAECAGRPLILLAAVGFEAHIVRDVDTDAKQSWGPLAYYLQGFAQLTATAPFSLRLVIDKVETHEVEAVALTLANAAPPTSALAQGLGEVVPDDGMLDITVLLSRTLAETVEAVAQMAGTALIKDVPESPHIRGWRARRIEVEADPPQLVAVDGEVVGETPVSINCRPGALKVLAPHPGDPDKVSLFA